MLPDVAYERVAHARGHVPHADTPTPTAAADVTVAVIVVNDVVVAVAK